MHVLDNLNDLLEEQVEHITKKGDITPTELDNVYKAVKTMNYIETIKAMHEYNDDGYSQYGPTGKMMHNSYRGGSYTYMDRDGDAQYNEGNSYRGRSMYSRADEKENMISKLERMRDNASSEAERQTIMECIRKIER